MTDRPESARVRARRVALCSPPSSRASRSPKARKASVKVDSESGSLVACTPLGGDAASSIALALWRRLELAGAGEAPAGEGGSGAKARVGRIAVRLVPAFVREADRKEQLPVRAREGSLRSVSSANLPA